jgi:hypothetical protein
MLENKSILYIGPRFFGYEVEIQKTLEAFGAEVDFYDDRPSNDFLMKLFIRLKFKSFVQRKIEDYYHRIYENIKLKTYDYVFVIAPETLNYEKLEQIKKIQSKAEYILYMWDSFENKNSFNTIDLFDKVITFDSNDATKYKLNFLALFYIKKYEEISDIDKHTYAICFTATAHSDRYQIAKKIEKQLNNFNLSMVSFFYLPNSVMYWVRKLFINKYQYGSISDFSFSSLSQSEIISIVESSQAVLDVNHPLQYGLTSRSIEALGANRKLITTNSNVKTYDFYNENNILIIDRKNPFINEEFFHTDYIKPNKETYEKYSLENWLINVFDLKRYYGSRIQIREK